jgi:hypothetical protein
MPTCVLVPSITIGEPESVSIKEDIVRIDGDSRLSTESRKQELSVCQNIPPAHVAVFFESPQIIRFFWKPDTSLLQSAMKGISVPIRTSETPELPPVSPKPAANIRSPSFEGTSPFWFRVTGVKETKSASTKMAGGYGRVRNR